MASKQKNKVLRALALWGSIFYLLVLGGILYALEHTSDQQWYLGAMLYLPPEGWLLPLMILTPLALLVRPWVCLLHVAGVLGLYIGYLDHNGAGSKSLDFVTDQSGSNAVLTVVTANIGQRNGNLLSSFIEEKQPDLIAFQEAVLFPKKFVKNNADYDLRREGEFTLASRLPVRRSGLVEDLNFEGRPVAAWFEVGYLDQTIVIYSVHMPTPRAFLIEFGGGKGEAGGELLSKTAQEDFKAYWNTRFILAKRLLKVLQKESRPMLVVGDFNTPDHGQLYKLFASQLADAFAIAGQGGGDTFPANARGGLFQVGAWMRLDYQFASNDWIPVECSVEPPVRAQHLAVVARYELLEKETKLSRYP